MTPVTGVLSVPRIPRRRHRLVISPLETPDWQAALRARVSCCHLASTFAIIPATLIVLWPILAVFFANFAAIKNNISENIRFGHHSRAMCLFVPISAFVLVVVSEVSRGE